MAGEPIERFLEELSSNVEGKFEPAVLKESLDEIKNHLVESALEYESIGLSRLEAEERAIKEFGVAEKVVEVQRSRRKFIDWNWKNEARASVLVVGLVIAVILFEAVLIGSW